MTTVMGSSKFQYSKNVRLNTWKSRKERQQDGRRFNTYSGKQAKSYACFILLFLEWGKEFFGAYLAFIILYTLSCQTDSFFDRAVKSIADMLCLAR